MAARAGHGQAQHAAADGFDLLIDDIHAENFRLGLLVGLRTECEETGGGQELIALRLIFCGHEISRDLLTQEYIVRFAGIECGDDIIAVAPGMVEDHIAVAAIAVGVAGRVQPVAAPALAEVAAGEQFIHQRRNIGLVCAVRRQTDQVHVEAPDETLGIGLAVWGELLLCSFGRNKAVDAALSRSLRWNQRPQFFSFLDAHASTVGKSRDEQTKQTKRTHGGYCLSSAAISSSASIIFMEACGSRLFVPGQVS